MSQATIVSENPVFTFSYRKALVTKFDLTVKKVKVNPGSSFEQIMIGRSPDATYQVSLKSVNLFRSRMFLKGFYHMWA